MYIGTPLRDIADCRVHGCDVGECIRQGSIYVCKHGKLNLFNFHLSQPFKLAFQIEMYIFVLKNDLQIKKQLFSFLIVKLQMQFI